MTTDAALPRVRTRVRDGLRPLDWRTFPAPTEFWPDKVRITLRGRVEWDASSSFSSYLGSIAPSRYFAARPTIGRRFRADIRYGASITGKLTIVMASPGLADEPAVGHADIILDLNINPTTARALAIRRNEAPLETVSHASFFNPFASAAEAFGEGDFANGRERALDGAENVLLSVAELGGYTAAARSVARNGYLKLYERRLRELCYAMLSPSQPTDKFGDELNCRVYLDWGELVLRQAELYVEHRHDDAIAIVHRLYDRALDLARRVKAQNFSDGLAGGQSVPTTFAVSQNDGYPHLIIPLTGTRNVELSLYAKTGRRVRFEVRYRRNFGHQLRGCGNSDDRLTRLLLRLTEDAAKRLPWRALARAATTPPNVDVAEVPNLIAHLVSATRRVPSLFQPVVRQLLMTGGVIADEGGYPGIGAAIRELVRRDVLWRWNVQQKEERESRRYGLTERYAAVRRKMISGFIPLDDGIWWSAEPGSYEDHYDESARIMGGQQWVSKPS